MHSIILDRMFAANQAIVLNRQRVHISMHNCIQPSVHAVLVTRCDGDKRTAFHEKFD